MNYEFFDTYIHTDKQKVRDESIVGAREGRRKKKWV